MIPNGCILRAIRLSCIAINIASPCGFLYVSSKDGPDFFLYHWATDSSPMRSRANPVARAAKSKRADRRNGHRETPSIYAEQIIPVSFASP